MFWTLDEDFIFSLLVVKIILMSYGFFWPILAVHIMRFWSSVFVTVCRTGSNLKQQPAFILPRAALNITQLGSGQSGKYSANTFLKTKELNVQHSNELFWCDGCHSDSNCLFCVRWVASDMLSQASNCCCCCCLKWMWISHKPLGIHCDLNRSIVFLQRRMYLCIVSWNLLNRFTVW
jgi:hypothetical protein